jgi:hypothetical protein
MYGARRITNRLERTVEFDSTIVDPESGIGGIGVEMIEAATHKELAISLFNQTWDLLDKPDRTADEDFLMIHKAHASLFHWLQVGTALHEARGQWQVSRVYSVLKWHQPALAHGERCLQICLKNNLGDFDLAFGYEAVARAHSLAGKMEEARKSIELGRAAASAVENPEDQDYVRKELDGIQL